MSFLDTAKQVVALFPVVVGAVKTVEDALPDSKGKEKLAAAQAIITTVSEGAVAIWPLLEALIAKLIVAFGFNKSAASQPTP
jgi:hypothetical protein